MLVVLFRVSCHFSRLILSYLFFFGHCSNPVSSIPAPLKDPRRFLLTTLPFGLQPQFISVSSPSTLLGPAECASGKSIIKTMVVMITTPKEVHPGEKMRERETPQLITACPRLSKLYQIELQISWCADREKYASAETTETLSDTVKILWLLSQGDMADQIALVINSKVVLIPSNPGSYTEVRWSILQRSSVFFFQTIYFEKDNQALELKPALITNSLPAFWEDSSILELRIIRTKTSSEILTAPDTNKMVFFEMILIFGYDCQTAHAP